MTIYAVQFYDYIEAEGDYIDSYWKSKNKAQKRAKAVNKKEKDYGRAEVQAVEVNE